MWEHITWPCGMLFSHDVCFFQITENFNVAYLKWWKPCHEKKTKCACHTPLLGRPAAPHLTFGFVWHCWAPNSCSMAPHTTRSFGFLIVLHGTKGRLWRLWFLSCIWPLNILNWFFWVLEKAYYMVKKHTGLKGIPYSHMVYKSIPHDTYQMHVVCNQPWHNIQPN